MRDPRAPCTVMVNAAYLNWAMHRLRARRRYGLAEVAARSWELAPAELLQTRPAIYLDGALERILGYTPWNTPEYEQQYVHGGPIQQAATRAHLIEDIRIAGPMLYRGAYKSRQGHGGEYILKTLPQRETLEAAHLTSGFPGHSFFGPFLRDITVEMLPGPEAPSISMSRLHYAHEDGYRHLLELPRPRQLENATIQRLTLYEDFGQNSRKEVRYRDLRRRLRAQFPTRNSGPAGVYLRRGTTGEARFLVNEPEIETVLAARGFDIIEPSALEVDEIVRRCLDARIIVSVEGSHVSHAVYTLADDGAYLILQPPYRFAMAHKEVANRLDQRFAFETGTPAGDGFTIDAGNLQRLLDQLS